MEVMHNKSISISINLKSRSLEIKFNLKIIRKSKIILIFQENLSKSFQIIIVYHRLLVKCHY